ncbi:MAG: FAD-dependent oxidoreductase, partial [Actinobacteria bacterium]|nr:FAD-dependent oxidoreductase [Actinomycetota bacterium]
MDRTCFDVVIVGAGPAGIFAALELVRRDGLSVLLVEKGPDIDKRRCPARTTGICAHCEPCDITCGWGGAGAFSDGKLTLSPAVGGWLTDFVSEAELQGLIDYVDGIWREYGAPDEVHGGNGKTIERLRRQALLHGLTLVAAPVRHVGTERAYLILTRLRAELEREVGVATSTQAVRILT